MKILCGEKTLDLEKMNAVAPDGQHAWAGVAPFTYEPDRLPESDAGTYILTSDRGAVSLRDMAFKILFDMCVWSGARCGRYLAREIARSAGLDPEHGWDLEPVPEDTAAGKLLQELGTRSVKMPRCDRTLEENLGAFHGPCDLDGATNGLLSEYIYTEGRSFVELHGALSALLHSFPPEEFAAFVDGFYGVMSLTPEEIAERQAARMDNVSRQEPVAEAAPEAGTEQAPGNGQDVPEGAPEAPAPEAVQGGEAKKLPPVAGSGVTPASGMTAGEVRASGALPVGPGLFTQGRMLKGSDLTGTDETYIQGYYTGFYNADLAKADSEGFADMLIKARAGDGTSPIAILGEAVEKLKTAMAAQSSGESVAAGLKGELMELSEAVFQVADAVKAAQGLPEAGPGKVPEAAGDGGAGEGASDGQAAQEAPAEAAAPDVPDEPGVPDVPDEPEGQDGGQEAEVDLSGVPDYGDEEEPGDGDDMEVPDERMPDEEGPGVQDPPDLDED